MKLLTVEGILEGENRRGKFANPCWGRYTTCGQESLIGTEKTKVLLWKKIKKRMVILSFNHIAWSGDFCRHSLHDKLQLQKLCLQFFFICHPVAKIFSELLFSGALFRLGLKLEAQLPKCEWVFLISVQIYCMGRHLPCNLQNNLDNFDLLSHSPLFFPGNCSFGDIPASVFCSAGCVIVIIT